jgi:Cu(I)/Ag(I) efflux system membrane fusion protein
MKALFPLVTITLALAVVSGCHKEVQKTAETGDLKVAFSISPDPPVAGENHLHVELHDTAHKPVDGAKIGLVNDMAAMGSMAEMKGNGETRSLGDGRYDVAYSLPMLGDWTLILDIDAPGHLPNQMRLKIAPPRKGFTVEGTARSEVARGGDSAPGGAGTEMASPLERQQLIGVTYGTVEERPLSISTRAAGRIEVDERQLSEVTLKYEAYVRQLYVGETGQEVKQRAPLLLLYSPDLLAAEEELLQARAAESTHAPGSSEIMRAAARRLRLWDLTDTQIAELEKRGKADGTVVIHSPVSGSVLDKNVVEGTHAMPGTVLYRIGNLGRVWVQADFYEADAAWIALGQPATIALPMMRGPTLRGRISFVSPTLDTKTRTLHARIELPNAALRLKPGMFVDVEVSAPLGTKLTVPDSALLLSGEHRYAFIERGPGKLQAVEVEVGASTGEYDEVRAGLSEGDRVVIGANFLISSEAQLRDALPRWSTP